jgi:Mn2+/Fe2+ NRAMP family transporter
MANDTGMAERAEETVDYSNHTVTNIIAWAIWLVITAANVYALVEIGRNPP